MVFLSNLLPGPLRAPQPFQREPLTLWRRLRQKAFIWQYGGDAFARQTLRMESAPVDERGLLHVRLRGLPDSLLLRAGPASDDRATLWEIFFHQPYDGLLPFDYRTVLDLGANIGLTLAYLIYRGAPLERYIGVEPDPETFAVLRQQVESLGMQARSTLFNCAVSDRRATVRFDSRGQSILHAIGVNGNLEVPTRPVAELLDEAGVPEVDLMKLDIEGGERDVLRDAHNWVGRVKRIVAELHHDMDAAWLRRHLQPLGFRVFDVGVLFREGVGAVREDVAHELPPHLL